MDKNSILHQVKIDHFLFPAIATQDLKMIAFCRTPYEKHPQGCPNWNHKQGCPPRTKPFLSLYHPNVFVVLARLDFALYLKLKKAQHPDWTDKALRNPRHWQGHLRAALKNFLIVAKIPSGFQIVTNSEAMGINLFQTCQNEGLVLERTPTSYVCHVNLLAKPLAKTPYK